MRYLLSTVLGAPGSMSLAALASMMAGGPLLACAARLVSYPFAFICGATALYYGLASGPSAHFPAGAADASIWGILRFAVPGVASIRAIGRFAALGTIFLFPLPFFILGDFRLSSKFRAIFPALILTLSVATVFFDETRPPYANRCDFSLIVPKPDLSFGASFPCM